MRRCKGAKHAHFTQTAHGHWRFMLLCKAAATKKGMPLNAAERSHIRVTHAAEITAASRGKPWPKKNRDDAIITSPM